MQREKLRTTQIDHQKLADRMAIGDREALREMLAAFAPKTLGWLKSHFYDVLDEAEIQEALNVAAFNAWRFAGRYDSKRASLGTWFTAIARRAAQNILRAETAHRSCRVEYDPEYDPTVDPREPAIDALPSDSDRQFEWDLHDAIAKDLKGLQREIILADLAAGEQADNSRLAERCNTTVNSIKVSRNKARKNLKAAMQRRGYDENARRRKK